MSDFVTSAVDREDRVVIKLLLTLRNVGLIENVAYKYWEPTDDYRIAVYGYLNS